MVTTSRAATVNLPTTGIVTVYDKETEAIHSQDYWTNIGADDAEGMTTLMALSINRNYKHGPLRMLFTYDEETNQQGAKTLGPEVLDADYLINIDTGGVGTVTISSAGILRANLKKQYKEVNTNKNKEIDVSIKNLLGGHSGEDIAKDRLCANEMFIDMISLLEEQNITCNIKSVLGGNAANAISSAVDFSILVDSNDVDKVKNLFNEYFDNAKKSHPNEKDASIEIVDWQNPITIAFSDNDSKQIINVLKMIPHGVREMNKDFPNQAATSLNLAIINAGAGSIDICSHSRSQEEPGNDAYDAIYKQIQSDYGYTYEVYNRYSG